VFTKPCDISIFCRHRIAAEHLLLTELGKLVKEGSMNPKELFGREVLDANARSVGRVSDIDFDMSKGVVNHLVVKTGPIKKHIVTFDNIAKIGDKVILKVTQQMLDRLA